MIKFKREFLEKWIAALRSGEYEQGRGRLVRTFPNMTTKFCCLGVACEIMGVKRNNSDVFYDNFGVIYNATPPFFFKDKILLAGAGYELDKFYEMCVQWNDTFCLPFTGIANRLENILNNDCEWRGF